METENVAVVQDTSALENSLVAKLTGKLPVSGNDLSGILTWGHAELSGIDRDSLGIITSTMASLVTEQEVVGAYVPVETLGIVKSRGTYEGHAGLVERLRLGVPESESDDDVYNPEPNSSDAEALFKKKPINISTRYYFKPFAKRYSWTEGSRWFTGLLLKGSTVGEIYAMMRKQVEGAQRLALKAQELAALRSSMLLNLGTVEDLGTVGNTMAINVLAMYNEAYPEAGLTADKAIQTPEFLRFAGIIFETTYTKMGEVTPMYNEMEYLTASENLKGYFNSEFVAAYKRNYLIDAFNASLGGLIENKTIAWWKSPKSAEGVSDFKTTSTIHDTIEVDWESQPITVHAPYVLGTIIDSERIGVYNFGVENAEQKDASALSTNYFSHVFGSSLCDPYYNAVTFYMADPTK